VVDPAGPELTAWEMCEARYVEVARVRPGDVWTTDVPFPVTIAPADLLDD